MEFSKAIENAWDALSEGNGQKAEEYFSIAQDVLLEAATCLKKYRRQLRELDDAIWAQYMLDSEYEPSDWELMSQFYRRTK